MMFSFYIYNDPRRLVSHELNISVAQGGSITTSSREAMGHRAPVAGRFQKNGGFETNILWNTDTIDLHRFTDFLSSYIYNHMYIMVWDGLSIFLQISVVIPP